MLAGKLLPAIQGQPWHLAFELLETSDFENLPENLSSIINPSNASPPISRHPRSIHSINTQLSTGVYQDGKCHVAIRVLFSVRMHNMRALWSSAKLMLQTTALKSIKSLVPLLDRVLVQRVKAEAKTAGGIFLPESSVKELNEAKVLAVGPGGLDKEGKRIPMSVGEGDKVLIPQV